MGRFRSVLRHAVKPAAMVAVVGALSLSLVVTTPSTAHALQAPVIDVKPTFVQGAQKVLSPGITNGGKFVVGLAGGPWIKAAKMLGMVAFSTSDLWMPVEHGNFGQPDADKDESIQEGYRILPGFRLTGYTVNSARSITMSWQFTGDGTHSGQITTRFNCRQTVAEYQKPVGFMSSSYFVWQQGGVNASTLPTGNLTGNACPVNTEIDDGTMGPQTGGGTTNGPENTLTHNATGGFSPDSPDVTFKTRTQCVDAAGVVTWIEALTSGANEKQVLVPSCAAAGKGHGTGVTQLLTQAPGSTTWETMWDTGPAPLSDPSTPLCDPGKTSSGCTLSIEIDGKPCLVGDPECENWPEVNQNDSTQTRVKCKFGPYTLPTASCGLLEPAYVPGGAPVNDPNTDGNPSPRIFTDPNGNPVAAPAPAPVGGTPGIAPVPGGSGSTTPGAEQSERQCWPKGWAMFNPLEWVLKPMRCAFEPTRNFAAEGGALRDRAMTKAPLSFVTAIAATAPVSVGGQGACPAWVVNIGTNISGQNGNFSKNVVCDSSFIQAIVNARPVLFGLISGAMLWPFLRSLWYSIIPVVRVVPTGGK